MDAYRKAHYTLRHRMIATLSQRLDGITYTQRHGLIRGMRRQGGLGFLPPILAGHHETAEHTFLRSLPLQDRVVYEIGAFQGILTLFFSSRAKAVIAYEPNPPSYNRVLQNLRLNGCTNVQVRNLAVGERAGSIRLLSDPLMPGGTSGDPTVSRQIEVSTAATSVDVPVVTIDEDMAAARLPPPHLVKIDIEGMELPALKGMVETLTRYRPDLYMEMHGATMAHKDANVRAIVDFLDTLGYPHMLHVESGARIARQNATAAREGHLFASFSPAPQPRS
ncbi:MAG TPA: FkbM family methyltransferase [Vicinamibacterales bacterium]|nr:FkbM family methyltransferase [Vicinamibacterales bacterium]